MRYVTTATIYVDKAESRAHMSPVYRAGNTVTTLLAYPHQEVSAADVERYDLLGTGAVMPVPATQAPAAFAEGGNGDTARKGIDTTSPGTLSGGNIVGTDLEGLSDDELEERGIQPNDAYKRLQGEQAP
ncbi:MAG: hypothetical protein M3Q29_02555 [Chloroflexota bacterium]|nr:hypothetical protein [Chloroflexota bacterium]